MDLVQSTCFIASLNVTQVVHHISRTSTQVFFLQGHCLFTCFPFQSSGVASSNLLYHTFFNPHNVYSEPVLKDASHNDICVSLCPCRERELCFIFLVGSMVSIFIWMLTFENCGGHSYSPSNLSGLLPGTLQHSISLYLLRLFVAINSPWPMKCKHKWYEALLERNFTSRMWLHTPFFSPLLQ